MITNESFLLPILDYSPLATAIYDSPELHIAYVNQAMLEIWHADRSIIGRTFSDCFPSFEKEGFSSILKNVWKTGITYRATDTPADIVYGDKKSKRYFDFEYKALLNEDGNSYAILHTCKDVTERKLAYDRMQRQSEQLSLNQKLDLLTNKLSHDLKNPLAALKMSNAFLSKDISMPADKRSKWYENIAASIQSMECIITQTLELSKVRGSAASTESIAMDKLIENCIIEAKLSFPGQQVQFRLGHLHTLYADKTSVYQIFTNLIGNAVKYARKVGQHDLHIYSEKTNKGIVYYLEDNGAGDPEKELSSVFDAREAMNGACTRGTGIGLTLAKDLVEGIGGTVNLSSQVGKGTIIRLFFPFLP